MLIPNTTTRVWTRCARTSGADLPIHLNTPYVNTIRVEDEVPYPGDRAMERRIKSLIRWNAMAMVVRQNKYDAGIGGHISTYASLATLLEVGFNHFFHARYGDEPGDLIYFQGHASPGVYARAFLEGRPNLLDGFGPRYSNGFQILTCPRPQRKGKQRDAERGLMQLDLRPKSPSFLEIQFAPGAIDEPRQRSRLECRGKVRQAAVILDDL